MRIRFYGCLLAVLTLVLSAVPASAQQSATGTITGRITDKGTQSPIAGAVVQAMSAGRAASSAITDADGQYRMANVPAGTYSVVVNMVGYEVANIGNVRVLAGENSIAGVALTTAAFVLNPVVVSASKHSEKALDAPAAVSVVPEREIAERPATSVVEHLRSTPGVDVVTTGVQSTNVVARGFNNIFSGALHTLTDYRAAGVPSLRVNYLQFVPQTNEDLSRIEVVLGPGSALYGPNTANGVLHLITKSPLDEQGTTFTLAGGAFPGAKPTTFSGLIPSCNNFTCESGSLMHATFRTAQKVSETFGVKVSGQYFKADEFFYSDSVELATKAGLPTTDAGLTASPLFPTGMTLDQRKIRAARIGNRDYNIERYSGDFRADWRPTTNFAGVLSAGLTNDNSIELTGIGAGQVVDWKYSYVQGRANYKNWFAQSYLNMSDAGDTYLLRNGTPISDQSHVWVTQLQHIAKLGTKQSFTYGADYIATTPVTNGTINGVNENKDNYNEVGAYLQSETNVSKMLEVVLAGRYDKHSRLDKAVWSPRAALVFKPSENHNFRATYNRAFSTPTSLNLFLDLDAGPLGALGPFGFRAHVQAPGRTGISLHDASGALQIRSPFNPTGAGALVTPTLSSIYNNQVTAIAAAAALPSTVSGAMRNFANDPAFAASNALILSDPLTGKGTLFSTGVRDVAPIEESTTSTYEIGYKGILGEKLLLAVDAWHARHKNFTSPLIAATPLVLLSPTALVNFVTPRLSLVFQAGGMPKAQADPTALAIATNMAKLPGGVISSAATTEAAPNLILTYINFGDISLDGADLSLTALLSSKWQLGVTASVVSDDYFKLPLGNSNNDSTVVALNAPKKKGSATLTYRDIGRGLNAEARVRHQDEFPANSAGFVGLSCVDPTALGACVKAYTLVDLMAGTKLPVKGASIQLMINNLFDEKYQSFIGTPEIRRMAMLRLRYDL